MLLRISFPFKVLFCYEYLLTLSLVLATLGTATFRWFVFNTSCVAAETIPSDVEQLQDQATRVTSPDLLGDTEATLKLPDSGTLKFYYRPLSDSGVRLRRLNHQGKIVWEQKCAPLGVLHSEYYHKAFVYIEGKTVRVVSRGSGGSFVEILDLSSGRRITRSIPSDVEQLQDQATRVTDPNSLIGDVKATLKLLDGGILEFQYNPISDSGVRLQRLNHQGKIVWEQDCAPLGVLHSEYYHKAFVYIEGETVKVISVGSRGSFVERLDLSSGKRIARSIDCDSYGNPPRCIPAYPVTSPENR